LIFLCYWLWLSFMTK